MALGVEEIRTSLTCRSTNAIVKWHTSVDVTTSPRAGAMRLYLPGVQLLFG